MIDSSCSFELPPPPLLILWRYSSHFPSAVPAGCRQARAHNASDGRGQPLPVPQPAHAAVVELAAGEQNIRLHDALLRLQLLRDEPDINGRVRDPV